MQPKRSEYWSSNSFALLKKKISLLRKLFFKLDNCSKVQNSSFIFSACLISWSIKVIVSFPYCKDRKPSSTRCVMTRGENSKDIFRPYLIPTLFGGLKICPYPNTQIAYLWCWYPIVSYPAWLTLSVFESESRQKYENKCNISDIRPYPIRFHPYMWLMATSRFMVRYALELFWNSG